MATRKRHRPVQIVRKLMAADRLLAEGRAGGRPFVVFRACWVSERFACRVAGQDRATQRHEPIAGTPDDPDAALREWLRTYAKKHPRRGCRPAHHDARGEGCVVNH